MGDRPSYEDMTAGDFTPIGEDDIESYLEGSSWGYNTNRGFTRDELENIPTPHRSGSALYNLIKEESLKKGGREDLVKKMFPEHVPGVPRRQIRTERFTLTAFMAACDMMGRDRVVKLLWEDLENRSIKEGMAFAKRLSQDMSKVQTDGNPTYRDLELRRNLLRESAIRHIRVDGPVSDNVGPEDIYFVFELEWFERVLDETRLPYGKKV